MVLNEDDHLHFGHDSFSVACSKFSIKNLLVQHRVVTLRRWSFEARHRLSSQMSFLYPTRARIALRFPGFTAQRYASSGKPKDQGKKKKKARNNYLNQDLSKGTQFSLCDAMRYVVVICSQ